MIAILVIHESIGYLIARACVDPVTRLYHRQISMYSVRNFGIVLYLSSFAILY